MDKLKLEQVGENEWMFVWPRSSEKASDLFFESIDYAEKGNFSKAKQLLNKAVEIFPQHIDAIHHLSLIEESNELNDKAVNIGLSIFPKEFNEKSLLKWGWTENRPFLRVCHTKGLILLGGKKLEEAIKLFNQMIVWNPNDNQGVRSILADIYINNKRWDEMMNLSDKYPDDYDPSMSFGLALALYKKQEEEKATIKLKKAVKRFPLCGKILLEESPKKPKSEIPGYISCGGPDQAYEFWEQQGNVWKEDDVRKWLKSLST